MKNTVNKIYAVIGSALLTLVLSFVVAAFPAQAHAQQYNGGYVGNFSSRSHYCPSGQYPVILTSTGYWQCESQPTVVYQQPTYQPPVYQQPTYQPPVYQYPALTASCYATNSSIAAGTMGNWTAYVSGGAGNYTYSWSGTDGLYGSSQSAYMTYYNSGYKTASLYVYSGGQTINVACSGSINVYDNTYYQPYPTYNQTTYVQPVVQQGPTYVSSNASGLQVGCYSDPNSALVNQPVTWNVEVTGGAAPYVYSWSGSDGLTGTSATIVKYYQSSGDKSAVVSVTSADGRSTIWSCSNTVAIHRVGGGTVAPTTPAASTPAAQGNNLGASAFFSLNNIPWGWVAVLVILVLFATVMYLLFNKTKI